MKDGVDDSQDGQFENKPNPRKTWTKHFVVNQFVDLKQNKILSKYFSRTAGFSVVHQINRPVF